MMLNWIAYRGLNTGVPLVILRDNVYFPEDYDNPWFRLRAGTPIWVMRDGYYDVYELTKSWNGDEAEKDAFIDDICREANP